MRNIVVKLLLDSMYQPFFKKETNYPQDFYISFKDNAFALVENNVEKELYLLNYYNLPDCKDEKTYQIELDKYKILLDGLIKQIQGFNILYRNKLLSYNINLILLCNFINNPKFQDLTNQFFASFERNKYVCRKIFLNTSNKEEIEILNANNEIEKIYQELMLLPFIQINNKFEVGIKTTLLDDLNNIVKSQEKFDYIYYELGKEINTKKITVEESDKYCKKIESLFIVGEISNE